MISNQSWIKDVIKEIKLKRLNSELTLDMMVGVEVAPYDHIVKVFRQLNVYVVEEVKLT